MNVLPEKELCLRCKGRGYCNLDFCPAYAKLESLSRISNSLNKEQFSSSVPGVFVGKFGYPTINVGLLAMPEISRDAWLYDSPSYWGNHGFDISKVIEMRSSLINSRIPLAVRDKNHLLDSMQEVAMSSRPVDVEILLSKKPFFKVSFEPYVAPIGANAALKEFTLTENPCIPVAVDKAVSDTDLKAADAIMSLSKKHFDETALTRLLSIGNLGVKFERKLVPTRWSITAVDDIIGKDLIDFVKQASDRMPYSAFFGGYLGNYFLILCFPEPWSYELFETYAGGMGRTGGMDENAAYTTDYENYSGRKTYAENCAGGYYAARLSILEKLSKLKKQATVLCLRFITNEYWAPLGVWVVREAVRKAMAKEPIEFDSREYMLKYAEAIAKKKFNYNINILLKASRLIKEISSQKKLTGFL